MCGGCVAGALRTCSLTSSTFRELVSRAFLQHLLKDCAPWPGGLRPQPHRALVADLTKTALADLVAFRPTHLIFDFIDERLDLLSVGATLVTRSWELEASGYLAQPALRKARPLPPLSAAS